MTANHAQIERLVREVMERLGPELRGDGPVAAATHNGTATSATNHRAPVPNGNAASNASSPNSHALVLHQKLIALADVEGRVPQGSTVAVAARAIITPAARDYLRARQAHLMVAQATVKAGGSTAAGRTVTLAAAIDSSTAAAPRALSLELPDRLSGHLTKAGMRVERIAHVSLPGTVADLSSSVSLSGNLGVLITDETAAALCLANRHRGVRAATAAEVVELETAWKAIAVNLLILNPRGTSSWKLMQIAQRYCGLAAVGGVATYSEVLA